MANTIDRAEGRVAFGRDAAGYHPARPAYPDWVFETLRDRCSLKNRAAVFEIWQRTGTATRRMLDPGANPLVAIEPDQCRASLPHAKGREDAASMRYSTIT